MQAFVLNAGWDIPAKLTEISHDFPQSFWANIKEVRLLGHDRFPQIFINSLSINISAR
jgi:hypothetical protein